MSYHGRSLHGWRKREEDENGFTGHLYQDIHSNIGWGSGCRSNHSSTTLGRPQVTTYSESRMYDCMSTYGHIDYHRFLLMHFVLDVPCSVADVACSVDHRSIDYHLYLLIHSVVDVSWSVTTVSCSVDHRSIDYHLYIFTNLTNTSFSEPLLHLLYVLLQLFHALLLTETQTTTSFSLLTWRTPLSLNQRKKGVISPVILDG